MIIASNVSLLTGVFTGVLSLICGLGTESSTVKMSALIPMGFAPEVVYLH